MKKEDKLLERVRQIMRLECGGTIFAHCNLALLDSGNPLSSASCVARTEGLQHLACYPDFMLQPMFTFPNIFCQGHPLAEFNQEPAIKEAWAECFSVSRLESSGVISAHCNLYLPGSKTQFHHVGQDDPNLLTLGSAQLSLPNCWDDRCEPLRPATFFFFCTMSSNLVQEVVERGYHHVGQAGLELLTSNDPPASASQCAKITEMGFNHVGQAGLKLLTSSDPPTSASPNAEITGTKYKEAILMDAAPWATSLMLSYLILLPPYLPVP
ncbi:4F2 cell-surface antigen heavy chain [Plecturocebus cupreus]